MKSVMARAKSLLEQFGNPAVAVEPETGEPEFEPEPDEMVEPEPEPEPEPEEEEPASNGLVAALRKHLTSEAFEELLADFIHGHIVKAPANDDVASLVQSMDPNDVLEAVREILAVEKINAGNIVKRISREFV